MATRVLIQLLSSPHTHFLLAADKDNRPVHVVESEEGGDGNFATVAFTMVSVPLLLVLFALLHICTDACASYACSNAT